MKFPLGGVSLALGNLLFAGLVACSSCQADDSAKIPPVPPPTESELRNVITKGLGFLATAGDEWMAEKNCISCHHVPGMLWSFREAGQRGFPVDEKKFAQWVAWTNEAVTERKLIPEEAALTMLAMPGKFDGPLSKVIAESQQADGAWKPANQFATMQKRGATDAAVSTTLLGVMALATAAPRCEGFEEIRGRAALHLQKDGDPTSMEALVVRAFHARHFGQPAEVAALMQKIAGAQRGDGGWSFMLGENMSDPLATGQALFAMQLIPSDPPSSDAIARAQQWLVKSQREEGQWITDVTHVTKVDRSSAAKAKSLADVTGIYTYWGSSWAVLGLLQGIPATAPAPP